MSWLPDLGGRRTEQVMMSLTTLSLFVANFEVQRKDFDIMKAVARSNGQRSVMCTSGDVVVSTQ